MSVGNLNTQGQRKVNYPYQIKSLQALKKIADLIGSDNVDFESQLVVDSLGVVALEVRIWDQSSGSFNPPIFYEPGTNNTVTLTPPVKYVTPAVPETKTTNIQREIDATNSPIAAGAFSVSIANVGAAAGTVKGETLNAGETINFDAGATNNTLDEIAFNASGTEFLIISIT